jgi:Cu-Zn family superoxide dismutase
MQRIGFMAVLAALTMTPASGQEPLTAIASFVDSEGEAVGAAELSSSPAGGVLLKVEVSDLPEETWVAFHIHETGNCDHATDHESAGEHFNPGSKEHGYMAENGPHAGDMPNQYVGADGTLRAEVFNYSVTLADGDNGILGRALMVHAAGDDYESQPSGDAGERLACAVIE